MLLHISSEVTDDTKFRFKYTGLLTNYLLNLEACSFDFERDE